MKFKIKILDSLMGFDHFAILNKKDADFLDIHSNDRIKILRNKKLDTVGVVIANDKKTVPPGKIAIFCEVAT